MTPKAVRGEFTLQELSQMDRYLEKGPIHARRTHQLLASLCVITYNLWTNEKAEKRDHSDFAPWLFPPPPPQTKKDVEREADMIVAGAMGYANSDIELKDGQRAKTHYDVDWDAEEI